MRRSVFLSVLMMILVPFTAMGAPTLVPYTPDPTNEIAPTLEWNAVSNATSYKIEIDDQSDFSSPILPAFNTGLQTSYTGTLQEGDIYWRVGSDVDGFIYSDPDHFVIDLTPPTIAVNQVTSPTDSPNQVITGVVEAGAAVEVTPDTSAVAGTVNVVGTSWSCLVTGFEEGPNVLSVRATDQAGNFTDTTATVVYQSSFLLVNPVTSPTNQSSQNVSGTVESGAVVTAAVDTAATVSPVNQNGTDWDFDVTGLVEGDNTLTITATKAGVDPVTRTIVIEYDTTPPSLTFITPSSPTDSRSQIISGTTDVDATVTVSVDTSATASAVTRSGTDWSCEITGLDLGTNNITVTAYDPATNPTTRTGVIVFEPSSVNLVVNSPTSPTSMSFQTITGTTDSWADVTVEVDTGANIGTVFQSGSNWSCVLSGLESGMNNITVTATYNSLTNIQTTQIEYIPPPLNLTIDTPTSPTTSSSQTITGTVDSGATVTGVADTAAQVGTVTVTGNTWSCLVTGLVEGDNTLTFTAEKGAASVQDSTTIQYNPPPLTLTLNPVSSPTSTDSQMISGTVDPEADVAVTVNTGATVGAVIKAGSTWQCLLTNLEPGFNNITVTATKGSETAIKTDSIQYVPSSLSVTIDSVTTPTSIDFQQVSGTMTEGASVSVTTNTSALAGPVTYDSTTSWTCMVSNLAAGPNTIIATATSGTESTSANDTITYEPVNVNLVVNPVTSPTNSTSQLISGTVTAGSTVSATADTGAVIGIITQTGSNWSFTVSNLSSGLNRITVTATYGSNTDSKTVEIIYDGDPPFLSIDTVVTRTNETSQTIEGRVETGAVVSVAVDSPASAGMVTYPSQGMWSCTITGLDLGGTLTTFNITVTATDTVNNTATGTTSITYDASSPSLTVNDVTSPTNASSQTISGTMESGAVVSVVAGSAVVGSVFYPSGTSWTCTLSSFVEGTVDITVKAIKALNYSEVQTSIVYDITPPNVAIDMVTTPTNVSVQTITGTMETGAIVTVSAVGAVPGPVTYPSPGTWSCVISGMTVEQTYDIIARATDEAGNNGLAYAGITYDITPPTLNINPIPSLTNSNLITVNGSRELNATVTITVDTTATPGIVVNTSDLTWECTVANLEETLNTITATATDAAGNTTTRSVSINYDGTPPDLTIDAVTTPTNQTTQTITGTREGGVPVTVTTNTGAMVGLVEYLTGTTWSCTITDLEEMENTITVSAVDSATNKTELTTIIEYDGTPPVLSVNPVVSPTNLAAQTITGVRESGLPVTVSANTSAMVTAVTYPDDISWSVDVSGLEETINTFTIVVTDLAGNETSADVDIEYDITPPLVAINEPLSPTNTPGQVVSGIMESGAVVAATVDTAALVGSLIYPSDITWNFPISGLVEGDNTVTVTAVDDAQNEATATVVITYDVTPPDLTIDPVTSPSNQASQTITGTMETGATITAKLSTSATVGSVTNPTDTEWSFTVSGLEETTNYITVTAKDEAGNSTVKTTSVVFENIPTGDVDGSGSVDLSDVMTILSICSGTTPASVHTSADVDGDGVITLNDAAYVLQVIAQLR